MFKACKKHLDLCAILLVLIFFIAGCASYSETTEEVITMAGGFTPVASPNKTRVIRIEEGEEKTIPVKINDIIKREKNKDIILKSGDIIVVPESLF